jgi:predicted YcjX-like family ATPase
MPQGAHGGETHSLREWRKGWQLLKINTLDGSTITSDVINSLTAYIADGNAFWLRLVEPQCVVLPGEFDGKKVTSPTEAEYWGDPARGV